MKYVIITFLQFFSLVLFAQEFNSVIKPVSLNRVSIRELKTELPPKESKDTIIIYKTDTISFLKKIGRDTIQNGQPSNIPFAKPLLWLDKTSDYGYRFHPILKRWRFHSGVDLASNADTVFSMLSGIVKESGYSSTLGYYLKTEHANSGVEILYAHLSEYYYLKGQELVAGQPIGITGSTGLSTGDHLHLAVYEDGHHVNPLLFMAKILNFNNNQITSSNEQSKRKLDSGINRDIRSGFASNINN